MKARIYQPSKHAMQSGTANTHQWILEFEPELARKIDPLMGWTSSADMRSQIRMKFDSQEAAEAYADRNGLPYEVMPVHKKKRHIQAYADNFK